MRAIMFINAMFHLKYGNG